MKPIIIPENVERKELFSFLLKNKSAIIQQKKLQLKVSNVVGMLESVGVKKKGADMPEDNEDGVLQVKAVINTTNLLDSCCDVHLPGLWKKSLSENKMLVHLQEHDMCFENIISDGNDLKAYTQVMPWKELGQKKYQGVTEALIFDSTVREERNEFMYDQYLKGYVKNHSVCMQYVKMVMCVNEPEDISFGAEYEAWQKYYKEIANKEAADQKGYFWAIQEAKIIEGSAVPLGANPITPTLDVIIVQEPTVITPKKSVYSLNISTARKSGSIVGRLKI